MYVYNQTINHYKLLPLPHVWEPNRTISGMAIASDPTVPPHYKVLYALDDFTSPGVPIHIEIYSSGNRQLECLYSLDRLL